MKFLDQVSQKPTFPKFDIVSHKYMPGNEGSNSTETSDEDDKPADDRD
jgi:hypothetical protein